MNCNIIVKSNKLPRGRILNPIHLVVPDNYNVRQGRLILQVPTPVCHRSHHFGKVTVTHDPEGCPGTHVGFVGCRRGAIHADDAVRFIDDATGFGSYESTSTVDDCTGAARLLYRL